MNAIIICAIIAGCSFLICGITIVVKKFNNSDVEKLNSELLYLNELLRSSNEKMSRMITDKNRIYDKYQALKKLFMDDVI